MDLLDQAKYKYTQLNVLEKLIAVNVIVFVLAKLLNFIAPVVLSFVELPSDFMTALLQPWSIFTYGFLHYDFMHLFFNMLWLYFVGQLFLNLFNPKTALNVFLLGVLFGGALFILGYNLLPSFFGGNTHLVGASAGVRALLIFLCAYMPHKEIHFFTFKLELWWLGVGLVAIDVFGIFGSNSGGNLAHLGGALLGYFYAKELTKGNDIGSGFERFMKAFMAMFDVFKKPTLKTVHKKKSKVAGYKKEDFDALNKQKKIDAILDKISKNGYDGLTKEEKEFLFRAGK